jgi:hypothetical protein
MKCPLTHGKNNHHEFAGSQRTQTAIPSAAWEVEEVELGLEEKGDVAGFEN